MTKNYDIIKNLGAVKSIQQSERNKVYIDPKYILNKLESDELDIIVEAIDDGITEKDYEFATVRIYIKAK